MQGYQFSQKLSDEQDVLAEINSSSETVEDENRGLLSDITYYANPDNLEKKARELLNVKRRGQHTIIVVPRDQ